MEFNTKLKVKKGDYNYEKWVAIVDFVGVTDQDKRDWLINYFQSMEDTLSWTPPPFPDTPPKLFDDKNDE